MCLEKTQKPTYLQYFVNRRYVTWNELELRFEVDAIVSVVDQT